MTPEATLEFATLCAATLHPGASAGDVALLVIQHWRPRTSAEGVLRASKKALDRVRSRALL